MRALSAAFIVIPLVGGCGQDDSHGNGAAGASTGAVYCYLAKDKARCSCSGENEDSTHSASEWTKVSGCNAASVGAQLVCSADTTLDGKTTSCYCEALGCKRGSNRCDCTRNVGSDTSITACTGYEWCCAADNGTSCYCSNGTFGSACGNDEHNVKTCARTDAKPGSGDKSSCDGLTFAARPPSSGGGGSSGGCKSSSECLGKCSTRCYDCRSGSCACGRIGSSGSCIY